MEIMRPKLSDTIENYLMQRNVNFSEKLYTTTLIMSREENIKFAIACATAVLDLFEKNHPDDKRPRLALEMAEKRLMGKRTLNSMLIASNAFIAAAEVAYNGDAEEIATVSFSSARSAAHAARCACVEFDGNISENAYDAALYALQAMGKDDRADNEDLILMLLAEVISEETEQ